MKKTEPRLPEGSSRKTTWRAIVVDILVPMRGKTVCLKAIYYGVAQHPEAINRAESNKHVRPKVRQVLQQLRKDGVIGAMGKGWWHVHDDLEPIEASY